MIMIESKQPRKQRKWLYNAPLHESHALVHVHLSKELRAKLKTKKRAIAVRKGDRVKVMRGSRKGHVGKVTEVSLNDAKVSVEGVNIRRAKGTEVPKWLEPSNLMITDGDFSKDRKGILERK